MTAEPLLFLGSSSGFSELVKLLSLFPVLIVVTLDVATAVAAILLSFLEQFNNYRKEDFINSCYYHFKMMMTNVEVLVS